MNLWSWALAAYPRPGVEAACLALQDEHGVNVCYLLWAAWGEAAGQSIDLPAGAALAADWEDDVAGPLRRARRALKPARPAVADIAREGLRGQLQRLELAAERLLLDSLEALPPGSTHVTLTEAAARWRPSPPAEAVMRLHAAITNPVYAPPGEHGA